MCFKSGKYVQTGNSMDLGVSISAVFENILSLVVADGDDTRTPQSKIGDTAAGVSRERRMQREWILNI